MTGDCDNGMIGRTGSKSAGGGVGITEADAVVDGEIRGIHGVGGRGGRKGSTVSKISSGDVFGSWRGNAGVGEGGVLTANVDVAG